MLIFSNAVIMSNTILENPLTKKMLFFYGIELLSAIAFTILNSFSGLIWLAVAISFMGIIPKLNSFNGMLDINTRNLISRACLLLSSLLWGYIILYSLTSAPVIYTSILVARILSTIITFKDIKDHIIVVVPLLLAFALLKPAGCIPPIAF